MTKTILVNEKPAKPLVLFIYLLLLFMPDTRLVSFLPTFRLEQVFCMILFISLMFKSKFKIIIQNKKIALLYLLWVVYIIFTICVSGFRYQTLILSDLFEIYRPFIYIIQFYVLLNYVYANQNDNKVISGFCLVLGAQSILGILQVVFPNSVGAYTSQLFGEKYIEMYVNISAGHIKRAMGTIGNSTLLGFIISLSIALNFFHLLVHKNRSWILKILLILNFIAIYCTKSRTAFLISVFFIIQIYLFVYQSRGAKKTLVGIGLIVSLIIFIGILTISDSRLLMLKGGMAPRYAIWQHYYSIIQNNIVFGAGINKSIIILNDTVDNEHLQMLLHYGVVGYIFFIAPFITNLKLASPNIYQRLYSVVFVGAMLFMIPAVLYNNYIMSSYMITVLAIIYKGILKEKKVEVPINQIKAISRVI